MSVAAIYDFEGVFEPPIAALFQKAGMIVYMSRGRLNDDGTITTQPDFQKDRPRVEVVFTRGAGRRQWHLPDPSTINPNIPTANQARESAWIGNLAVTLLTNADPIQHFGFLPGVRNICANLPQLLDGVSIQNHCLEGPMIDAGESHRYNKEERYYATDLNYRFDFSVQRTSWPLLTQP